MVANEFIDRYMAVANGEYVKVYLYLLRHDGREITVGEIADALNHTESDVKRAIAYWVRLGVLEDADAQARSEGPDGHGTPGQWMCGSFTEGTCIGFGQSDRI